MPDSIYQLGTNGGRKDFKNGEAHKSVNLTSKANLNIMQNALQATDFIYL